MVFKVPLGLDKGKNKLVCPMDAIKGATYYCPGCEAMLILKDGEIRTTHFAHKNEGNCTYDTYVHNLAQKIILDNTRIFVDNGVVQYEGARKECVIGDNRIDAIIDAEGYIGLLVEVVVTNPLTDKKLNALVEYDILEIDLSTIDPFPDIKTFTDLVLNEPSNKSFYPKKKLSVVSVPHKSSWQLWEVVVGWGLAILGILWFCSRPSNRKKRKY
jgi:Competence protein CoiA-like family